MMKSILEDNSKYLNVNTYMCNFVDLRSEGFYLEFRIIQTSSSYFVKIMYMPKMLIFGVLRCFLNAHETLSIIR